MIELNYREEGGYLYPEIELPSTGKDLHVGKYSMMRKTYLKEYKPEYYSELMMLGELDEHLSDTQRDAKEKLEIMMPRLIKRFPPPDKATHQLEWVGHMETLKAMVEEVIFDELIYT